MTKPNLAILHYAAPPTIGGVESTLAAHARLFVERGYRVKVLAGRGGSFDPRVPVEIIPDASSSSPRIVKMNEALADGRVSEEFHQLARDLALTLERSLDGYEWVLAHNVLSLHKNLALTSALNALARTGRIRLIAWCHDFAWTDPQYAGQVHAGHPWDLLKTPWDGVRYVVVSEARKMELEALWGPQVSHAEIAVVPPGIDPCEFFGISPQVARWIVDMDLLDAAPLLLLPARITRRKNVEFAVEVTAELRKQGWKAVLLVTGPPGPHNPTNAAYLESLRTLRRERGLEQAVILLHEFGRVYGAAMRDLYLLADALLFPSEREGFGIPLLEAGLARLPVFCSDLAPFRESARDDAHYMESGLSPAAAAASIGAQLQQDPAFRLKQRVVKQYTWDRVFAERIEPLLSGGKLHAD